MMTSHSVMPSPMSASLNRWRLFHKAEEECRWVLSAGRRAARRRRRANMAGVNKRRSDEHGGNPEGQMMALADPAGEEVPPCQRRQLSRPRVAGVVNCCITSISQSERDASVKSAGKLDFTCGFNCRQLPFLLASAKSCRIPCSRCEHRHCGRTPCFSLFLHSIYCTRHSGDRQDFAKSPMMKSVSSSSVLPVELGAL